jgi:tRNA-2-methylthio-N6-dimethylallyladenosine synthase
MKFYIETYGCQMNVADSELVTTILLNNGNEKVETIENAEVIIFNTCSVRQHAEDRVLGRIANELRRKKANPRLRIGVIGCMAQRIGNDLIASNPGVDFVAGVDQYNSLPAIIADSNIDSKLDFDEFQNYSFIQPSHAPGVCGFVTIMRGCNNYCSYCIVPYVRGRERSRPLADIVSDVGNAVAKGIKDITLLGQNVNSFNYNGYNFPKLLKELNKLDELSRIRFVTSHPKDLSDELIEVMSTRDKICEHIHLPMQSGDNDILAKMNRGYTVEHYAQLINKLRNAIPEIAITTDLIAGFPGETDEQFENTVYAMKSIGFDYAFCFKYSNREGTEAVNFIDQIDEKVRLTRLQKLIGIQRHQTKLKFEAQIGRCTEVLVEGKSRLGGSQLSGKTRDFKICVFDGYEEQIGSLVKVKIIDATAGTLIGEQSNG